MSIYLAIAEKIYQQNKLKLDFKIFFHKKSDQKLVLDRLMKQNQKLTSS